MDQDQFAVCDLVASRRIADDSPIASPSPFKCEEVAMKGLIESQCLISLFWAWQSNIVDSMVDTLKAHYIIH